MTRRAPLLAASLVSASLCLTPLSGLAAPPESGDESGAAPVEGPSAPPTEGPSAPPGEGPGAGELPPPTLTDPPVPLPLEGEGEGEGGIEFAVPPPEGEAEEVAEEPAPVPITFPDPGMAPNDGNSMLVLGGTTVALTLVGFSVALAVGLQRDTELEWLLPSTIVPTVGLLAFGGGGLYSGIKRAVAYRRWEVGYRVIGTPQGGGLTIAGSFALLGAIGFGSIGGFALRDGYVEFGASLLAVGIASGVATPIMFAVGARRARAYQRTGGWKRPPLPPLPPGAQPGAQGAQLRRSPTLTPIIAPAFTPLRGGVAVGASGRF